MASTASKKPTSAAEIAEELFNRCATQLVPEVHRAFWALVNADKRSPARKKTWKAIASLADVALYAKAAMDQKHEAARKARNRQSAPDTIKRNLEICDRKKAAPTLTSGQLAKFFGVTSVYVRAVLKDERKWRGMKLTS